MPERRSHNGITYYKHLRLEHPKWKYVLIDPYQYNTHFTHVDGGNPYMRLDHTGVLRISAQYAWNGPSGPTIDTRNFMRGSLVHDALYQLMRERVLDHRADRKRADQLLRIIVREDGMSWLRAWWVYRGVRWFGASSARPP
ncbi:MAG: DUF1353 domain-containing protein [Planctomycetota bacterium]